MPRGSQIRARLPHPNSEHRWIERPQPKNGDMAVVVATLHQKRTALGKPRQQCQFSDTYIRDNGVWRCVHAHASRAVDVENPAT